MNEAELVQTDGGLEPAEEGWFVVNAADACWWRNEAFGASCAFESGDMHFPQLGINLHVLEPGKPNGMYHRESAQEDFLVLRGECLLLIDGQERRLRAWDFVHCPPGVEHIFVGAGEAPCVVLMAGARPGRPIVYPESELASRHGAAVATETNSGEQAYARFPQWTRARVDDDRLPWSAGNSNSPSRTREER